MPQHDRTANADLRDERESPNAVIELLAEAFLELLVRQERAEGATPVHTESRSR